MNQALLAQIGYLHDHPGTLGEVAAYMKRLEEKNQKLVTALRDAEHALTREDAQTIHRTGAHDTVTVQALVRARCLLHEVSEAA